MKAGIYENVIELSKRNDLYEKWSQEISNGGKRTLEEYFDEYSDRNIVSDFISDMCGLNANFIIHDNWNKGILNWRKSKIEIL